MSAAEAGAARAWILAFIVLAGVGIGTLVGVGCLVGANTCPGNPRPKPTATDGATLFLETCAGCHGVRGEGGRGGPSLLTGDAKTLSLTDIEYRIEHGKPLGQRGSMPAFRGELTKGQIQALAAYVVSLRGDA